MLGTPLGRILFDRPAWTYLLGPFFKSSTPDQAAPLSATYREAGAVGALTITDAANLLSVSGGELVWSGTTSGNTGAVSAVSYARVAGRAVIASATRRTANGQVRYGWQSVAAPNGGLLHGIRPGGSATTLDVRIPTGTILTISGLSSGLHEYVTVLRSNGAFSLYRTDGSATWTLAWVFYGDTTTPLYAHNSLPTGIPVDAKTAAFRVTDLPGAWDSDYGIATDRKATSAATDTITHAANCLVEHTITAATGVTQELWVRRTDASNGWIVRMSQAGSTIKLIELVAGVETERASTAQTWTNATAYRVVVICDGTTITPYVANVAKTGYSSASTNQSATTAYVSDAGTDLVAWPRTVALPTGV